MAPHSSAGLDDNLHELPSPPNDQSPLNSMNFPASQTRLSFPLADPSVSSIPSQ